MLQCILIECGINACLGTFILLCPVGVGYRKGALSSAVSHSDGYRHVPCFARKVGIIEQRYHFDDSLRLLDQLPKLFLVQRRNFAINRIVKEEIGR